MDSSNKLNFILGEFTVPTSKIEGFEWLKIINAALAICKPYLKYFPEFRPISEQLNYIDGYDRRETDEAIIEFPKGITQKTCCVKIDDLIFETEGEIPGGNGVRFIILQTLFLSREGKWINRDYKFERKLRYRLGYRSHHTGILEVAKICKFSLVKKDTLLDFLKGDFLKGERSSGKIPLGQLILDILYSLVIQGVKERKERLQQIEQVEERLARIRNRIEFL